MRTRMNKLFTIFKKCMVLFNELIEAIRQDTDFAVKSGLSTSLFIDTAIYTLPFTRLIWSLMVNMRKNTVPASKYLDFCPKESERHETQTTEADSIMLITDPTFLFLLLVLISYVVYWIFKINLFFKAAFRHDKYMMRIYCILTILFYCTIWPCINQEIYYEYKVSDSSVFSIIYLVQDLYAKLSLTIILSDYVVERPRTSNYLNSTRVSIEFCTVLYDDSVFRML